MPIGAGVGRLFKLGKLPINVSLQAYDYVELNQRYGCRLQMGGSDQWGNIVNGIELTRRIDGSQLYGLTTPLLTTADGLPRVVTVDPAWPTREVGGLLRPLPRPYG